VPHPAPQPHAAPDALPADLGLTAHDGGVTIGPLRVPAAFFADAATYRAAVRAAAIEVAAAPEFGAPLYGPKAQAELELLLALWPHALALPVRRALAPRELMLARAWPVHPLGVNAAPAWADGRLCSPAEFFYHDLDHARFKLREDLLALGHHVPDAYRDGTTFDAPRGAHRTILDHAAPFMSAQLWRAAPARAALVSAWLAAIAAEPQRVLADAASWLLFELLHEKSLPVDRRVLATALAGDAHVAKLRTKCLAGFYRQHGPSPDAVAALPRAQAWLAHCVESLGP
jgi:hypothetical protein